MKNIASGFTAIALAGSFFFISACGSVESFNSMIGSASPQKQKPQIIWTSAKNRPLWRKSEPTMEGGFLYFPGQSKPEITQELAKERAVIDATRKISKFLKNVAQKRFKEEWTVLGDSPIQIDPADASAQYEKNLEDNMSGQVDAYDWYIEKWAFGNHIRWKVSVLTRLPNWVLDKSLKTTAQENLKIAVEHAMEASSEKSREQAEQVVRYWKEMEAKALMIVAN